MKAFRIITAFFMALAFLILPVPASAATYYVPHPFTKDSIPVYDITGYSSTLPATYLWENGTGVNLWRTYSDPASGIAIRWNSARAGSSVGGWVEVPKWVWSNNQWEISDCIVNVNTNVGGAGRPYGRWYQAIVTHEVGHCIGHWTHSEYPHIMRPFISKSGTLSGYAYRPTNTDLARVRAGMATN